MELSTRDGKTFQETLTQDQQLQPLSAKMKASPRAWAVAVLLVLALCLSAIAAPVSSDPPSSCCFTYAAKKIPRNYITDYYETNSRCSQPGVVFITKKGREICANPAEKWVQDYMDHFELN